MTWNFWWKGGKNLIKFPSQFLLILQSKTAFIETNYLGKPRAFTWISCLLVPCEKGFNVEF